MIWSPEEVGVLLRQSFGASVAVTIGKDDVSVVANVTSESLRQVTHWAIEQAEIVTSTAFARQLALREVKVVQTSFLRRTTDTLPDETGLKESIQDYLDG